MFVRCFDNGKEGNFVKAKSEPVDIRQYQDLLSDRRKFCPYLKQEVLNES